MISSALLAKVSDICVETEELGIQSNSGLETLYFSVDDIDGTDNAYRGNWILPHCTCICAFNGRSSTRHAQEQRLFSDMLAGVCIEHLSKTIFYAEKGRGSEILDKNLNPLRINQPVPNFSCDRATRILTDLYAGRPRRLVSLYESTWVRDFGSSAIHYCLSATGLFDGLVFQTYKAHELGLAYIFAKENGRWLSDFSLVPYDNKPYIFNGAYEVLIAHNRDLALKLSGMID